MRPGVHLVSSAHERFLLLLGVVGTSDFPVVPELLDRPRVRPELEPAPILEDEHASVSDARHRRLSLPEILRVVESRIVLGEGQPSVRPHLHERRSLH